MSSATNWSQMCVYYNCSKINNDDTMTPHTTPFHYGLQTEPVETEAILILTCFQFPKFISMLKKQMDIAAAFILVFVAFLLFPFKINEPTKINSEPPICSSIKQSSLVCIYFTCDRSSHQMPLVIRPGVILLHF